MFKELIFYGNMFVIKDELDHFEEKFSKTLQIYCLPCKRSDPDPIKSFRIQI
jgi:hypothetical protein